MLDSFRDDNHLSGVNFHFSAVKVHNKCTLYDDKCLIGVRVAVPDEVAFKFHNLEFIVVLTTRSWDKEEG